MIRLSTRLDRINDSLPPQATEEQMLDEIRLVLRLPIPVETPADVRELGLRMLDAARKIKDETERDQAFVEFRQWSDSIHAQYGVAS